MRGRERGKEKEIGGRWRDRERDEGKTGGEREERGRYIEREMRGREGGGVLLHSMD